jgi:hypothetical protein
MACFASTNNPTGGPSEPDASEPGEASPGEDAAVVPREAAAVVPDAGADVVEEPAPMPVTVFVLSQGAPESGKAIVFSDPSGVTLATGTTDTTGSVVQLVPAGTQVTALLGSTDSPQLVTVVGVQPGDVLTAVDSPPSPGEVPEIDVNVTVPGNPPAGAVDYIVRAGNCGAFLEGSSGDLEVNGCVNSASQFPLLAVATDESSNTLQFASQKGNVLLDGGSGTEVTMTGNWSNPGAETIAVTGLTDGDFPYATYTEVANSVPYSQTNYDLNDVDAGTQSGTFETHPGYPDFVQTEVSLQQVNGSVASTTAIATRADAPSSSVAVDRSSLLPAITDASVDSTDPTRPSATWSAAAPFTGATGSFVQMFWNDLPDGGDTQFGVWTIVAPAGTATVQAPALPAGDLVPSPTATWDGIPTVAVVAGGAFADYTALRRTAGALASAINTNNQPLLPPLGTDGTLKISIAYEGFASE